MPTDKRKWGNAYQYMKYAGLAFQIGGTIIIFTLIGKQLDAYLQMERPIFTAVLALLGTVGGMYVGLKDLLK